MRQIREILQYRYTHKLSLEKTALSLRKSKGAVFNICARFETSGLLWPLPADMTDDQLDLALFRPKEAPPELTSVVPLPDVAYIERELTRKHVSIQLLYEEYQDRHPDGMSRASFYRYVKSGKMPSVTMHLEHKGGDTFYTDYSGDGLFWIDRNTGEIHDVELFVGSLAASSYTYSESTPSQSKECFSMSHARAFTYFGGAPASIVPDNLKSAVTKSDRYDPTINQLFGKMAEHYGTVVLPARVAKPRDKGSVESAVLVAQRRIIAALRNREFFSLAEINVAIKEQLEQINNRPMKDHGGLSRLQRFIELDKPFLKPLPEKEFRISVIKNDVLVGKNYHIQFEKHFYSVPFELATKKVDVHLDGSVVEIYHNGVHCCRHPVSLKNFGYTTNPDHRSPEHAFVHGLRPEWLLAKTGEIGPQTREMASTIMNSYAHPEHGFNPVLGLLRLAKTYSNERMENACARAMSFKACRYRDVKSILDNGLDLQQIILFSQPPLQTIAHENIRGQNYYGNNTTKE